MALFSDQGVQWISQSTDNIKSLDILRNLMSSIMSKLKLPDPEAYSDVAMDRLRMPVPTLETATKYIQGPFPTTTNSTANP